MGAWDDPNLRLAENARRIEAARKEAARHVRLAERWGRVALISIVIAAFLQICAFVLWYLAGAF